MIGHKIYKLIIGEKEQIQVMTVKKDTDEKIIFRKNPSDFSQIIQDNDFCKLKHAPIVITLEQDAFEIKLLKLPSSAGKEVQKLLYQWLKQEKIDTSIWGYKSLYQEEGYEYFRCVILKKDYISGLEKLLESRQCDVFFCCVNELASDHDRKNVEGLKENYCFMQLRETDICCLVYVNHVLVYTQVRSVSQLDIQQQLVTEWERIQYFLNSYHEKMTCNQLVIVGNMQGYLSKHSLEEKLAVPIKLYITDTDFDWISSTIDRGGFLECEDAQLIRVKKKTIFLNKNFYLIGCIMVLMLTMGLQAALLYNGKIVLAEVNQSVESIRQVNNSMDKNMQQVTNHTEELQYIFFSQADIYITECTHDGMNFVVYGSARTIHNIIEYAIFLEGVMGFATVHLEWIEKILQDNSQDQNVKNYLFQIVIRK